MVRKGPKARLKTLMFVILKLFLNFDFLSLYKQFAWS